MELNPNDWFSEDSGTGFSYTFFVTPSSEVIYLDDPAWYQNPEAWADAGHDQDSASMTKLTFAQVRENLIASAEGFVRTLMEFTPTDDEAQPAFTEAAEHLVLAFKALG
jgi:hypothetical protein